VVSQTQEQARTNKLFLKLNKIARQNSSRILPETVHDLRTTARRIETLLSTHGLDEHGPAAKLARQLAKLRRRAGKLRDVDVHIAALDGIRLENASRDKSALHDHLAKMRSKGEDKLVRTLDKEVSKRLLKRMKRAAKELQARFGGSRAENYTVEALQKFKALVDSYPRLTEKTLHNFRIDCKHVRYLAEMGGETPDAERVVSPLKTIQDAIGQWHDWLTLMQLARDILPNAAAPLMAALRTQTRSKFNEAIRLTAEAKQELLAMHLGGPRSVVPRHEPETDQKEGDRRAGPDAASPPPKDSGPKLVAA